jgi:uncharacterized protein (TIGR03067 family)
MVSTSYAVKVHARETEFPNAGSQTEFGNQGRKRELILLFSAIVENIGAVCTNNGGCNRISFSQGEFMKTLGLASFAVVLAVTLVSQGGDDAVKKEKAALQGVWKIVRVETPKGNETDLEGATFEFDKDGKNVVFMHNNQTKKGTYKLNPAGKPKEIDITASDDNIKTLEGIYKIDKNQLKICLCPDGSGDGRPSEFAVKDGKKFVLITLEKTK